MLEQAKEGLLAQASGYLSESLWVLVLEDLRELELAVFPKSKCNHVSQQYIKNYMSIKCIYKR